MEVIEFGIYYNNYCLLLCVIISYLLIILGRVKILLRFVFLSLIDCK